MAWSLAGTALRVRCRLGSALGMDCARMVWSGLGAGAGACRGRALRGCRCLACSKWFVGWDCGFNLGRRLAHLERNGGFRFQSGCGFGLHFGGCGLCLLGPYVDRALRYDQSSCLFRGRVAGFSVSTFYFWSHGTCCLEFTAWALLTFSLIIPTVRCLTYDTFSILLSQMRAYKQVKTIVMQMKG